MTIADAGTPVQDAGEPQALVRTLDHQARTKSARSLGPLKFFLLQFGGRGGKTGGAKPCDNQLLGI
jgi:hypothetical protein